jgi:hypothetical protein
MRFIGLVKYDSENAYYPQRFPQSAVHAAFAYSFYVEVMASLPEVN